MGEKEVAKPAKAGTTHHFWSVSVIKTLAFVVVLFLPQAVAADITTTLELMQKEVLAQSGVEGAFIDGERSALKVVMDDGTELTFSPDNLDRTLSGLDTEEERRVEVTRFVASLFGMPSPEEPKLSDATLAQVLPVVSVEGMFGDIIASNPDASPLVEEPLVLGLSIYYVLDYQETLSYLTRADLTQSGYPADLISKIARENLSKKSRDLAVAPVSDNPWIGMVTLDGTYEGSLMVIPEVWRDLEVEHGSLGLVYPGRGLVFVFNAESEDAREIVSVYLKGEMPNMPYPITEQMYEWAGDRWLPINP